MARWSPSFRRGHATPNIEAAHRHRAAPATLRLHRTQRSRVERETATSLRTLWRPRPRQRTTLLALEEPGARVMREHLATPRGMSPDRSPQGRPTLTCTAIKDGDYSPTVARDGPCCSC